MATLLNSIKSRLAERFNTLYYFYQYLGNRIIILMVFNFLMVLLDGLGLTLFVPLLTIAEGMQNNMGVGANQKLFNAVYTLFNWFHLEINVINMLIVIVCVFILKAFFVYAALKYQMLTLQYLARAIRSDLSFGVQNLSYKTFVQADVGRMQNSMTGEAYQVASACSQYLETIKNGMIIIVYLGIAFWLNWEFSLFIAVGGGLTNFIYKNFYKKTKSISREITKNHHRYGGLVIETVNHFKYLKATGRNRSFTERMVFELNQMVTNNITVGKLNARLTAIREPMMILIICGVIVMYTSIYNVGMSSILIILLLFYRAMGYIMSLQVSWNTFLTNTGALENIQTYSKYLKEHSEQEYGQQEIDNLHSIVLDSVSLQYENFKVLDNISLEIHKNQSIAFVGESGSGKTTLVNVICSLLPFDSGKILYNGADLKLFNNFLFKQKIGYVSQEPTIFNATIFENVTFWDEQNSENVEKFWRVIQMCSLTQFISSLTNRENEILGNNGLNISGGQKQRISIARELYREIEILILDEATAALDSETERDIKYSLDKLKGQVTIISIAHRLSTIQTADKIFLMGKGRILAEGNFEELKLNSKYFANLTSLQGL